MADIGRIPLTNVQPVIDKQAADKVSNPSRSGDETSVPMPYSDSDTFITDYFGIGTQWKDYDMVFTDEVEILDEYIKDQIDSGVIPDSQSAVKNLLRNMEKINNLQKEERAVVKLEVLANYAEFLKKNDTLKSMLKRYGTR